MDFVVVYFDDQQVFFVEVVGCFGEYLLYQVQVVVVVGQVEFRFMMEFCWYVGEIFGIYVGWIGYDQVEMLVGKFGEIVVLDGVDLFVEVVVFDIDVGYFQCIEGQVGEYYFCLFECIGVGDVDVVGIGVEVEDLCWFGWQLGCEVLFDKFGDR